MAIVYRFPVDSATLAPFAEQLKVKPEFLARLLMLLWLLNQRGIKWRVRELYRTLAQEQRNWAQGRNAQGVVIDKAKVVTYAPPGTSRHGKGEAADIDLPLSKRTEFGELAEQCGLIWGGRWTAKFPPHGDWGHVELPR